MPWTVRSLLPDLPVVEVAVSGTVTVQDIDELRRDVKSLLAHDRLERVLIDARDVVHLPLPSDLVGVAASMSTTRLPAGFRGAHIRPEDPWAAMWTSHWVAASNNRGIATAEFHAHDEAVDWLLSPSVPAADPAS
jgi:hypothetical protein